MRTNLQIHEVVFDLHYDSALFWLANFVSHSISKSKSADRFSLNFWLATRKCNKIYKNVTKLNVGCSYHHCSPPTHCHTVLHCSLPTSTHCQAPHTPTPHTIYYTYLTHSLLQHANDLYCPPPLSHKQRRTGRCVCIGVWRGGRSWVCTL